MLILSDLEGNTPSLELARLAQPAGYLSDLEIPFTLGACVS